MDSSLFYSIDDYSPCMWKKFFVIATYDNFLLLRDYHTFSYFVIFHSSANCYRVICYLICNEERSFYRSYRSIKDLCNFLETV